MAYRVKKEFQGLPHLRTVLKSGKAVALNQAHSKQSSGSPSRPPGETKIPLATQEELKELFEAGNRCVEQVADAPKEPENPFTDYKPEFPAESGLEEAIEEQQQAFSGKKKK